MKQFGIIRKILVILFWVGIWAAAAAWVNKPLLLPKPIQVFARIFQLAITASFWKITATTLLRIMMGILVSIALGVFTAVLTHRYTIVHELLSPFLTIVKVTPVASFILLALIWIGRDTVPSVISALMVFPVVWTNVRTGLKNIDSELLEMADIYRIPRVLRFKRIIVPSVMPYFMSAVQTGIGIGWKAGIAAEVLTVPIHSMGKMIYESKLYMETLDLFAWTIVVIVISLILEKILTAAISRMTIRAREVTDND